MNAFSKYLLITLGVALPGYSNSVKAHPLEIFLVILIAGTLAGIPGRILGIPAYTVIRVFSKEFLSQVRVVKKLTRNI